VCNGKVQQLFIDFEKACDSVRREVSYKILTDWYTYKISWLIKICLNETYIKIRVGKSMSDEFSI